MTASIAFDTLKFVERLEAGGFTHAQAKATAEAFAEATSQELATKADIAAMRADIKTEIADVKVDLRETARKLGADIRELELRMTIKLGGLIMAATGIILAAIKFVK